VLTADTYTSVLEQLHFRTAEATARRVLAAAAINPARGHRRRSQNIAGNPTRRPAGFGTPQDIHAEAAAPQGAPTHAPRTPHKDQVCIAQWLYAQVGTCGRQGLESEPAD